MLTSLKTSRYEFLQNVEGKIPKTLAKKLTLVKDLKETAEVLENAKKLANMRDKKRIKHLVALSAQQETDKLTNLIRKSSEMRTVLDPDRIHRQLLTIRFTAYDKRSYLAGQRFALAANLMGFKFSGPVGLPQKTKRWTVLKSPFKYKKHQESFEQRTIRAIVTLDTGDRAHLVPNLIQFIKKTTYAGVDVKIRTRRYISPEKLYVDPYLKDKISTKVPEPGVNYGDWNLDDNIVNEVLAIPIETKTLKVEDSTIKL